MPQIVRRAAISKGRRFDGKGSKQIVLDWSLNISGRFATDYRCVITSLAADGATACFSSNPFLLSLDADRAPQLKASVMSLPLELDVG